MRRISFYMKIIAEIINELGGDEAHAITLCPGKLAYVRGVRAVEDLTPTKVVLVCGKKVITAEGEGLFAENYFQGDMVIKGDIKRVSVE